MRVVVPIKQVATLDDDHELEEGAVSVDPDYVELELNEWDGFSVQAAIEIKEAGSDVEVVVVTVGDEDSEEALLAGLAKGADRAIRVWDDELGDLEPILVATLLAAAIRSEQPDLVLCGVQSSDAASSATGIALAGLLDLPHAAVARRVDFDAAAKTVDIDRELEGGIVEELTLPMPALLTVQTGANEPRYATLRAIKDAATKPLRVDGLADLGVDVDALASARGARTVALSRPPARGGTAEMLGEEPAAVAARLLEIIDEALPGRNGAQS